MLVRLHKECALQKPTENWEDFYAARLAKHWLSLRSEPLAAAHARIGLVQRFWETAAAQVRQGRIRRLDRPISERTPRNTPVAANRGRKHRHVDVRVRRRRAKRTITDVSRRGVGGRYAFDPGNARPLDDRRPLRTGADETEEAA
jgi:hypothetical protein